jgi:hypothetical protein
MFIIIIAVAGVLFVLNLKDKVSNWGVDNMRRDAQTGRAVRNLGVVVVGAIILYTISTGSKQTKDTAHYTSAPAIVIDPVADYNSKAWHFATSAAPSDRDPDEAIRYARLACEATKWQNGTYLDTYAAALASAGKFDDAVYWQKKALALPDLVDLTAEDRLKLYESNKPFYESSFKSPSILIK